MFRRIASSLLLLAFVAQIALSSLGSAPVLICFGGGHEHEHEHEHADTVVDPCQFECSHHEQDWPTPRPAEHHDDDCDCVDVELTGVEMLARSRITGDVRLPLPTPSPLAIQPPECTEPPARVERPPDDRVPAHTSQRLAVVRSTRMII